jgi:2-keto-4-pentenoate hydratase/2-oxohepta-3-ene-1,7-dioic acid hydratase in catechol pathway
LKLVRYQFGGRAHIGALKAGAIVDLAKIAPEYAEIRQLAAAAPDELKRVRFLIRDAAPTVPLEAVQLLPPIERPGKDLAIGMNYRKHAEEAERLGVGAPKQQLWFNKQTSCISGPFDDIDRGVTEKLDYEVELGVVIGKPARMVTEFDAPMYVFGYFVANDISARDWQFHSPTHTMGKSFDTHGPIGPCIVTSDEIPDPHSLGLRCYVNGEERQNSNTENMICNVWQQIFYLSTAFTLETGDILATGTPEGVGVGMDPPRYLKRGDVVRCEVDRIGSISNRVI